MPLCKGKPPFRPDPSDTKWSDVRLSGLKLPVAPKPQGGFGMDFSDWLMLGNGPDPTVFAGFQGAGDCFWAGAAHAVMASDHNARRPIAPFSGAVVIERNYAPYVASTNYGQGYDPHTGANDTGTEPRSGYRWLIEDGLVDDNGLAHKIGDPVLLDPENPQEWWEALWFFEQLGAGVQMTDAAESQFINGLTLTYDPSAGPGDGHYFVIEGHPVKDIWTGVMWGKRFTMTPDYLRHQLDELWVWLDPERYRVATGKTYEGYQSADLEHYIAALAAQYAQQ
jgi:hypothetical protein